MPKNYGIEINYTIDQDATIESEINTSYEKIWDHILNYYGKKIIIGFYPDIQGFKYVFKPSAIYRYGQVARVFAIIFGVFPYYDLGISALKKYNYNVYRKVEYVGPKHSFKPEIIKHEPDLEYYYKSTL